MSFPSPFEEVYFKIDDNIKAQRLDDVTSGTRPSLVCDLVQGDILFYSHISPSGISSRVSGRSIHLGLVHYGDVSAIPVASAY